MPSGARRTAWLLAWLAVAGTTACGGVLRQDREYEEEIYLSLDGSATVYVNASAPALVALRGLDLPVDSTARLDRQQLRAMFAPPGGEAVVTLSRRDGRRFVHVRIDVDDVRTLPRVGPLAWSSYRFDRRDDVLEFEQTIGPPAGRDVGNVGWTGAEIVGFKIHLPSEILYENADGDVERGNILEWEQPLRARLEGQPLNLEAHIATESILQQTLLLFGSTIAAAAAAFALVIWWVARRGRGTDAAGGDSSVPGGPVGATEARDGGPIITKERREGGAAGTTERRDAIPAGTNERRQGVPAETKERRQGVPVDRKERRQGVPVDRAEVRP